MATRKRTTMYSRGGKKLYAVRNADGSFKDIQSYARAHRMDMARKSQAELDAAAGSAMKAVKKAAKKVAKKAAAAKKAITRAVKKAVRKVTKKAAPRKSAAKKAGTSTRRKAAP